MSYRHCTQRNLDYNSKDVRSLTSNKKKTSLKYILSNFLRVCLAGESARVFLCILRRVDLLLRLYPEHSALFFQFGNVGFFFD